MGKWVQNRDANWRIPATGGWCLQYVRQAFGLPAQYPDATSAWKANDFPRKTGYPPAGITVPVYFSLGSTSQGHVAIRLDDLMVASSTKAGTQKTGYLHPNIQDLITMYAKYNKGCKYLGWKEGMGSTRFVTYKPTVTTKDVTKEDIITFSVVEQEDETLEKGKVTTKQKGQNGVRTVVTRITYSDGVESSRKVISDTTKKPVDQIIVLGTKEEVPVVPVPPVEEDISPVEGEDVMNWLSKLIQWIITKLKSFTYK